MAYRRSLSTRATVLIARAYNNPSFSYIPRDHHDRDNRDSTLSRREVLNFIQQRSSFGRVSQFSLGSAFIRYMSTSVGEGGGSDNEIELMSNVADVVSDATITTQVNEVAIAAADSFFPVAALQHFIDSVHNFTCLNWCASIVVATLLCRCASYPFLINQLKASVKVLVKMKQMEQQMEEDKATDPEAMTDCQKQMQKAHKENCTGTYQAFIPLTTGLYIEGAVFVGCLQAVSNMVDKVPSFKSGRAFWFTDLTTPDSFYILPILTGLSLMIPAEVTIQEFMKGDRAAGTLKNIIRGLAVLLVPLTMYSPKAICCYLITSNLFSLSYVLVLKVPGFRRALGFPEMPVLKTRTGRATSAN